MDFKQLMQKMQQLDEGTSIDECGDDMIAVSQGDAHSDDSLNMNLTISSKGASGIRDLINVLKGIDDNEPTDEPVGNVLFGTGDDHDEHGHEEEEEHAVVIGDNYKNSKKHDKGPHVADFDSLFPVGDDLASKGREARKQAGGGNPWNTHRNESLINHLSSLYEDVKSRSQKKR